jgi:hypothetical protein
LVKFPSLLARRRLARDAASQARLRIPRELGYELVSREELMGVDEVVQAARELIAANPPENRQWSGKPQLRSGNLDMSRLTLDSPYLRFALNHDVLAAVCAYLGVVPLLVYIDVWYSCHSPTLANSQLFHCDWGDLSQVKVFVHVTDIDAESGPLVVVRADKSQRIRDEVNYNYISAGDIRDERMRPFLEEEDMRTMLGPSGTVAFIDTCRCFHYGSRLPEGAPPRIVANFQFFTPFAFKVPLAHGSASPFKHLASPVMPRMQRMVLGAE